MSGIPERLAAALTGRYTIERQLGQGGMATVYLAEDLKHKRKVALKVLKPELAAVLGAERFVQEITTTAALQHPHILPLFDSGSADGFLFYVMPFIDGETLRGKLDRETQLGIDEAVTITTDVADALDYAHRHGVIHRDIKPENILLHDGRPMVADFGIALALSAAAGGRMTETGLSLGTPHYMSPEQATAEKEITARSDVYSLGSVLYEMLTGSPPHVGSSAQQIIMKIVTEEAAPVTRLRKAVPPNVAAAVAKAVEKLPADRFESAKAFGEALMNPAFATTSVGASRLAAQGAGIGVARVRPWLPWVLAGGLALTSLWLARRGGTSDSAGPIRFRMDLEQAQAFPNTAPVLVTPDGRTVIVSAIVDGQSALLSRQLDSLGARVIPGSAGANRAFLSPDGRWVAFAANGKLMKLPIEGGTPVALADARWGGGTWGADGTIIYSQTYQTGLWRVSSAGGDAREVTTPDSTADELAHWWPQLLPDARHVLFTAYRTPTSRATIEVLDLKTGVRKVLVQGGVMGRYVSTGHLLFARDESIRAVPFDLGSLTVTGGAVVVVDDVAMNYSDGFAAYDVSPSGTLVVMPTTVAGTRFQVVEVDRRGGERQVLAEPDRYQNPRYAPDLRRISLDIKPARGATDVWVMDPARGSRTRVTSEEASDFGAVWTPDGRDLLYMSERPLFELYRRSADGSRAAEQLLGGTHDRIIGSVSADGRLLTFVLSVSNGSDLWTVPLRGTPSPQAYLANGFQLGHPALSPDGRWMAYDSDESGRLETYIQSFPDPTLTRRQVSSGGGSEPLWTRGGRELVFRRGESVMAVSVDPATGAVGVPTTLFTGRYDVGPEWSAPRSYDVTPDGQRFLLLKWPEVDVRRHVVVSTDWWPELRVRVRGGD